MNNIKKQIVLDVLNGINSRTESTSLMTQILVIQMETNNWEELVDNYAKQIIEQLKGE